MLWNSVNPFPNVLVPLVAFSPWQGPVKSVITGRSPHLQRKGLERCPTRGRGGVLSPQRPSFWLAGAVGCSKGGRRRMGLDGEIVYYS